MKFCFIIFIGLIATGCSVNGFGPSHIQDFRQPPISAYAICDEKPIPMNCQNYKK